MFSAWPCMLYTVFVALHNFIAPRDYYNTRLFSLNQVILNLFLITSKKKSNIYIGYISIHTEYNKWNIFSKTGPNLAKFGLKYSDNVILLRQKKLKA